MSWMWTTLVPLTSFLTDTIDIAVNAPLRLRMTARLKQPIVCAHMLSTREIRSHCHMRRLTDSPLLVAITDSRLAVVGHICSQPYLGRLP